MASEKKPNIVTIQSSSPEGMFPAGFPFSTAPVYGVGYPLPTPLAAGAPGLPFVAYPPSFGYPAGYPGTVPCDSSTVSGSKETATFFMKEAECSDDGRTSSYRGGFIQVQGGSISLSQKGGGLKSKSTSASVSGFGLKKKEKKRKVVGGAGDVDFKSGIHRKKE